MILRTETLDDEVKTCPKCRRPMKLHPQTGECYECTGWLPEPIPVKEVPDVEEEAPGESVPSEEAGQQEADAEESGDGASEEEDPEEVRGDQHGRVLYGEDHED